MRRGRESRGWRGWPKGSRPFHPSSPLSLFLSLPIVLSTWRRRGWRIGGGVDCGPVCFCSLLFPTVMGRRRRRQGKFQRRQHSPPISAFPTAAHRRHRRTPLPPSSFPPQPSTTITADKKQRAGKPPSLLRDGVVRTRRSITLQRTKLIPDQAAASKLELGPYYEYRRREGGEYSNLMTRCLVFFFLIFVSSFYSSP